LRDEGEFAYKQALVNTILDLMDKLDGMKTAGLNALGEFIEGKLQYYCFIFFIFSFFIGTKRIMLMLLLLLLIIIIASNRL
jgi:hypothetical protein